MDDFGSPLISPSKARHAALQAKDWAYVTSWLQSKYSPNPIPNFERNEDTLKTLLALAAANDTADDEAALVYRAREEAVREYHARETEIAGSDQRPALLEDIEDSLDDRGKQSLDDLAQTAVELQTLSTDVAELGQGIIELTKEEFDSREQVRKVEELQSYLQRELDALRTQLGELRLNEIYETPADLPAKTTDWMRGTKILTTKVGEYTDRVASLERASRTKGPRIEELMVEEESVVRLRERVKMLEGRLNMFHGLPPDVAECKAEYKRLASEHRQLVQQRDNMFEGLVGHGGR